MGTTTPILRSKLAFHAVQKFVLSAVIPPSCFKRNVVAPPLLPYLSDLFLCTQDFVQSQRDVTQLATEIKQLRKEKGDLLGKVEALKFTVRCSHVTFTINGPICTIGSCDYCHTILWRSAPSNSPYRNDYCGQ